MKLTKKPRRVYGRRRRSRMLSGNPVTRGHNVLPKQATSGKVMGNGSSMGQLLTSIAGAIQKNLFRNL